VFGRGDNPINFVSVGDVAEVVARAVTDPTARGTTLAVGGPANLTMNQMAEAVQAGAGRSSGPRHVPPPMLRLMAETLGRLKPQLGRQARAALTMDRTDLTFDSGPMHRAYPDLPCTTLDDVLAASMTGRRSGSSTVPFSESPGKTP
jgi:NADH dehydrogenase